MAKLAFVTTFFQLMNICRCGPLHPPQCRFSPRYTQGQILSNPSAFSADILFWEGNFHQNNVSYNSLNGMSYDGTLLDPTTGVATSKHPFSAASKESLQVMIYAHALDGSAEAARFLSPNNPAAAPVIAARIMTQKLKTYLKFNATYPGFGGFLPWFASDSMDISPTWDWVNRVPALDNGELLWAVYSTVQVLESSSNPSLRELARGWQVWLDYTKSTAAKVFYAESGAVCAVTTIKDQSLKVNDLGQSYKCEGTGTLNDPYEGELFTWWLYFFGGLKDKDKEALWRVKRPQLVSVEYQAGDIGPITVQKGYWFSSHEQWKILEMPYYDIDIVRRVYFNAERARTCNSLVTDVPGMFASVNNSTDSSGQITGYISNAGIPSISNQTIQELDVITPYSVFPTVLVDKAVGLAWWKNMADGQKMQNPYGSTESARIDGTAISSFVSWDSKITTVNALLGGTQKFAREKMIRDGVYEEFVSVLQREYGRVFLHLNGEHIEFCLPRVKMQRQGLEDFAECH